MAIQYIQYDSTNNLAQVATFGGVDLVISADHGGSTGNLILRAASQVAIAGSTDFLVGGGDVYLGGATTTYWFNSSANNANARIQKDNVGNLSILGTTNYNVTLAPQGTGKLILGAKTNVSGTATTTNGSTPATVVSVPVTDNKTTTITCDVVSRGGAGAWKVEVVVKSVGGTISVIGSPIITIIGKEHANLDVAPAVGSGTIDFRVTGVDLTTVYWSANANYMSV